MIMIPSGDRLAFSPNYPLKRARSEPITNYQGFHLRIGPLREKWQSSLIVADKLEIVNEVAASKNKIPFLVLVDALKWVQFSLNLFALDVLYIFV